jgi:hypothetical protein
MTGYGRMNLAGMLLLPVAASLAALISFGTRSDTLITVFALNLVPMLVGGLVSWLLLRGAARAGKGQGIALWPTIIPAAFGTLWYLGRAVVPNAVAPGAEFLAGPQYLLIGVVVLGVVAWIGCRIARAR